MTGRAHEEQARPGDTDVWIVDLAASGAALLAREQERRLLTEPAQQRAERFADARLRERWLAAHIALHVVLGERLGRPVQFERTDASAKPRVVDWSGDFSLSHSGTLALIAVRDDDQVGIDVEVRRPVRLGPERRSLIERAGAALLSPSPLPADDAEMRFLTAWTRLEAIGKMRATGIGALLETLGIIANGPGIDVIAERARSLMANPAQPVGLSEIDVSAFDAVAAIATSPPAGALRVHTFSL